MKPAPFDYVRPSTLEEAIRALSEIGDDAKVLAGGQSLVPMLNLRLARPAALVDIGGLPGMGAISSSEDTVDIGGLCRHVDLERTTLDGPTGEVLRLAANRIGHLPIRVRGTIGGSLAHADPASEWCVVARALEAAITVEGPGGSRVVAAADFFAGYFTTALAPDEILTGVRLPKLPEGHEVGFAEFARRAGDFAIVAAATVLAVRDGRIDDARIALAGVADRPVRAAAAEQMLLGSQPAESLFADVAARAATEVDPPSDGQASADDRRDLVRALVHGALSDGHRRAAARAAREERA